MKLRYHSPGKREDPREEKLIPLAVILSLSFGACATIYQPAQFYEMRQRHHLVALLPFDVSISTTTFPQDVTAEMLKKAEQDEGYATQSLFYSRFFKNSADFA